MRRWTDGKSWSASRVSGSFLTYREMEGKRGGGGFAAPVASRNGKTPEGNRTSGEDREGETEEGPDGYRYKPDGLMKQSFSITTSTGQHLHLISYYARSHLNAPGLQQPSTDPTLRSIRPQKGMYPESTINDQSTMPAVTRSPMPGAPNYAMSPSAAAYGRPPPAAPPPPPPPPPPPHGYIPPGYAPPGYGFPPSPAGAPHPYAMHHAYAPAPGPLPPVANGNYPGPPYAPPASQAPPPIFDQRPQRPPEQNGPQPVQASQYTPPNPPAIIAAAPPIPQPPTIPERPSPPQQAAAALQIDPRLMGSASSPSPSQPNGGVILKPDDSPSNGKSHENPPAISAASQAPSIGALINGTTPSNTDTNIKSDVNGEQAGSASPGGNQHSSTPQDIPSEKLDFREDKRALRQLDKVFKA